MQIRHLLISLFLLLTPLLIFAQQQNQDSIKSIRELEPESQILALKNGILLVRLQLRERSLQQLREMGKIEYADKMETKQKAYNEEIVHAFRTEFHFCPVYFFSSNYTQDVKEKNFDKVVFLSDDLTEDPNIKIDETKHFLIAEFDAIDKGGEKRFSHYRYVEGEDKPGVEKEPVYYAAGEGVDFAALVISDDQFVQLHRPFPYYARTFEKVPLIERKIIRTVEKLNKKLYKYFYENSAFSQKDN
ncbi:MAG: hypothetical protein LBM67_09245 [Lentimicrobiaceae bacterium]|jgi:regulator of replication initiation timing|nr:hypothetical protein [Lentimicrobiaceae bacterium]